MASKADLKSMQEMELAKDRGQTDPSVRKAEQAREDYKKYGKKRGYRTSPTLSNRYLSEQPLSSSEKALTKYYGPKRKRKRVSK